MLDDAQVNENETHYMEKLNEKLRESASIDRLYKSFNTN